MPESAPIESFVEQFGALRGTLPGADLPWLRELREDGIARFAELGLPGANVEAWKYTRLRPLERTGFAPAGATAQVDLEKLPALLPQAGVGHRVIFVNGRLRQCLALLADQPEGVAWPCSPTSPRASNSAGWPTPCVRIPRRSPASWAAMGTARRHPTASRCWRSTPP